MNHQHCPLHKSWPAHEHSKLDPREKKLNLKFQDHQTIAQQYDDDRKRLTRKLSVVSDKVHNHDLITSIKQELSNTINKAAWNEKDMNRVQKEIHELKHKSKFSHIEHALLAFTTDPILANISTSRIHSSDSRDLEGQAELASTDSVTPNIGSTMGDNPDTVILDSSIQQELLDDQRRLAQTTQQLRQELYQAQHEITQIMTQLQQERQFHEDARTQFEAECSQFLQHNVQLQNSVATAVHHQDQLEVALDSVNTVTVPTSASITSPMKQLLQNYHELDNDSKTALLTTAITTNNVDLQRLLLKLRDSKKHANSTAQAKLAKELMKLANAYKINN